MLGVAGANVTPEQLERLFGSGCHPTTGASLGRSFSPKEQRAVAGFAVTFSPPKTVSVLWALADDTTASAVSAAHEIAVTEALSFLETHAAYTRRGRNGIFQVDTEGLVVASFTHRTPRSGDPQLHTHALVANKVRAKDSGWLAVDGHELCSHQKAAGMLYRRHAVTEDVIRELKYGVGLNHLPSGRFAANAAWAAINVLAHNLCRWSLRIGLGATAPPMTTKTLRRRLFDLPGRLITSARRRTLHLPRDWPWEEQFLTILEALRALSKTPAPARC